MANILILGAGGFGTALAVLCDKCGHRVTLYSPFQQEIETLSAAREHKKLLPGVIIPESGRDDLAASPRIRTPTWSLSRPLHSPYAASAPR